MDRWHCAVPAVLVLIAGLAASACSNPRQRDSAYPDLFQIYPHVGPKVDEIVRDEQNGKPPAHAVEIDRAIAAPGEYSERSVRGEATVREVVSEEVFFVGGPRKGRLCVALGPRVDRPAGLARGASVRIRGRLVEGPTVRRVLGPDLTKRADEILRGEVYVVLVTFTDELTLGTRWRGGRSTLVQRRRRH